MASAASYPVLSLDRRQPYRKLEKSTSSGSSINMMSANLVVIAFVRVVQIILASVILYKVYTLRVASSIEVFCPGNSQPSISYDVKYPFDYVHVPSRSGCTVDSVPVTDSFSTGFAPTAFLFTTDVVISIAYGLGAILFYCLKHKAYDLQKRLPAFDLLFSLTIGVLWAICAYMAWTNYPELRKNTSSDQIQMKATLCKDSSAYCSSFNTGAWEDMNTYLFLGIANVLSWGISVWFIFMETGVYADEYDYSDDILENDGLGNLPPTYVAFPEQCEKNGMPIGNGGMYGGPGSGMQEDDLMNYLKNYRNQGAVNGDEDRFANGYTFTPIVPSISESVQEKEDPNKAVKVHNKWNVFQA